MDCFSKQDAYSPHNASATEEHLRRQFITLQAAFSWAKKKALYDFFHICISAPQDL